MKKWLSLLLVLCLILGLPYAAAAAETPEYVTYTAMQTASTDTTVTVQLKFSEPVWIRSGNVWLCNHINPAACSGNKAVWQTGVVSSSPALTSTFQDNYADTYTLTFSRCTDATHTNHYNEWKNGLPSDAMVRIVDLISQYGGTALDGKVDEFAFKSQSGKPIAAVRADGGMEVAAENVELMPKIVSAQIRDTYDASGVKLLVTFSKPVHRGTASGHVYLCDKYNPNPNNQVTVGGVTYTSWQKGASSYEYVNGETGADGKTYSNQILFTFASPGLPVPATAGIRIVEYNAPAAEKNNGEVWSDVIADENGIGLMPTIKDGSVDISWMTANVAEASQKIVSLSKISATQVQINFAMMVKAIDVTGMTVGGVAVTAASRVGGDANGSGSWMLTLGAAAGEDDALLIIPANAVTMAYNGQKVAKVLTASTDPWFDYEDTEPVIPLKNARYHFMNADTGRSIAVKDGAATVDTFTVVRKAADSNRIALKYGGKYVNLRSESVTLVDVPVYYLLKACANERYQLLVNPDYAVADSDAGTDNRATMTVTAANGQDISTGWYITAQGDARPLRLLPLGDSLTDGVNYDRAQGELMVSYREELSEMLTEYFGRIVFVGAKKTASTTLDETRLLRHAGYSGYVIRQYWSENTYEQTYQHPGIDPFINDLTAKYNPDIVCLLLGHNDNSQMNMNMAHTGKDKEQLIAEWLVVYEEFVNKITDTMDDNDTIFCSSLTVNKDASTTNSKKQVNEYLIPMLNEMMADNGNLALADSWTATAAVGTAGFNAADNTHLNATGYSALANEWYRVITAAYNNRGIKKTLVETDDLQSMLDYAQAGDTVALSEDYDLTDRNLIRVPAGVTLDLNGHTVKGINVLVFGTIIDSTQGEGTLITDARSTTIIQPTNPMLPLFDSAKGGYRFFDLTVTNKTPRSGEGFVKYGFNLKFGGEDAYRLLLDSANVDLTLSVKVTVFGYNELNYFFDHSILAQYAEAVLGDPDSENNFVVTLKVSGLEELTEGATITVTPTLTSDIGASKTGVARTHTSLA